MSPCELGEETLTDPKSNPNPRISHRHVLLVICTHNIECIMMDMMPTLFTQRVTKAEGCAPICGGPLLYLQPAKETKASATYIYLPTLVTRRSTKGTAVGKIFRRTHRQTELRGAAGGDTRMCLSISHPQCSDRQSLTDAASHTAS